MSRSRVVVQARKSAEDVDYYKQNLLHVPIAAAFVVSSVLFVDWSYIAPTANIIFTVFFGIL